MNKDNDRDVVAARRGTVRAEEVDKDIQRYATMPLEAVLAELRRHGINPQRTIDAVAKLLAEHSGQKIRPSK